MWWVLEWLWDLLVGFLSGKTEVERICLDSGLPLHVTASRLEECIRKSSKLGQEVMLTAAGETVAKPLKELLLAPPAAAKVEDLCQALVAALSLNTKAPHFAKVRSRLLEVVGQYHGVTLLFDQVEALRAEKYDSSNSSHEAMLMRLWAALKPDVRLSARKTSEWGEIGFQGEDPATDFRGMGMLGLTNLVQFAETWSPHAHAVLADTATHTNWFGLAITGITVTADLYLDLKQRRLNKYFFQHGATLQSFAALYARCFVTFNEFWARANPPNVMSFMYIHNDFLSDMHRQAEAGELTPLRP